MIKKSLAALAVIGILTLGGAAAANAYPATVQCTASPATPAVGGTTTINCTGLVPGQATFVLTGPGVVAGDIASIVLAGTGGSASTTKTVGESGAVSASATLRTAGTYTVTVTDSQENTGSVTVSTAAAPPSGGGSGLPATGGTVPAAAIWLGVGAIGIGGIAVAAAVARRRANNR